MVNREDRARHFMPFAALRGYYTVVRDRERVVEPKRELLGYEADNLSYKIKQLKKGMIIKIRYYNNDAYETIEGVITAIDDVFRSLTIVKTKIMFDDILEIQGENILDLDNNL